MISTDIQAKANTPDGTNSTAKQTMEFLGTALQADGRADNELSWRIGMTKTDLESWQKHGAPDGGTGTKLALISKPLLKSNTWYRACVLYAKLEPFCLEESVPRSCVEPFIKETIVTLR